MGPGANVPSVPVEALSEEEQVCGLFSSPFLALSWARHIQRWAYGWRERRVWGSSCRTWSLNFFFFIIQSFVFLCDIRLFTYLCFSLVLFALHRQKQEELLFLFFSYTTCIFPSFFRNSHEFDIFPSILFHRHEATSPRFPLHRACPCRQRLLQDSWS